jgi:hypothetical protein
MLDREPEAGAVLTLCSNRSGPSISSMKMRPSCMDSTALAISISLRAAASGSAKKRAQLHARAMSVVLALVARCEWQARYL